MKKNLKEIYQFINESIIDNSKNADDKIFNKNADESIMDINEEDLKELIKETNYKGFEKGLNFNIYKMKLKNPVEYERMSSLNGQIEKYRISAITTSNSLILNDEKSYLIFTAEDFTHNFLMPNNWSWKFLTSGSYKSLKDLFNSDDFWKKVYKECYLQILNDK